MDEVLSRYKNEDRIMSLKLSGCPSIFNDLDYRIILRKVKENPKISAPILEMEMGTSLW